MNATRATLRAQCACNAGEVEAARRVAERALATIDMTAERDKFNVWVALMNLEDAYGGDNAEAGIMSVFNRRVVLRLTAA
jgi:rRNA biogenesis protein RRP5